MSGDGWDDWFEQDEEVEAITNTKQHRLSLGILRRLVIFGWPYRWRIALLLLLIMLSGVFTILQPLLFMEVVDTFTELPGSKEQEDYSLNLDAALSRCVYFAERVAGDWGIASA